MNPIQRRTPEERFNTFTHLAGVVFTLSAAWFILRLGYGSNWKNAFGTTCFTCGMLLMYAASTLYHWALPGRAKRRLRIFDHISIYVMIAASYTPICIGVVGGALGWSVFAALWAVAAGGAVYKIAAIDRYPRLSPAALAAIGAEGLLYTSGTWFFAHDSKPYFHGVWHLFVLLGSVAHWLAILLLLSAA